MGVAYDCIANLEFYCIMNPGQAFEKWQFVLESANREKFMLAGAIKRMLNRKLSMVCVA